MYVPEDELPQVLMRSQAWPTRDRARPSGTWLAAHVVTAKFCDTPPQPLYRQSQIFAREGVDLDRSILPLGRREAAALLAPVAEVLRRYVLDTEKLHGDDTPLPVLRQEQARPRQADSGPMFVTTVPAATVRAGRLFAYSPNRQGMNTHNGIWPSSRAFCRRRVRRIRQAV